MLYKGKKKGGKTALVVNEERLFVKKLCPDVITVPVGVEAVWSMVSPKNLTSNSKVRNIAVASATKQNLLKHQKLSTTLMKPTPCSQLNMDLTLILLYLEISTE